ncbi:alanine racemase [Akkermansiaceae bacterium]|nr:alanine racemase [Akkermansiaceae bacterium]
MTESPPRSWAEIDFSAMRENLAVVRRHATGKEIMIVIKADAYGHGMIETARVMKSENPLFFGVANASEARRLYEAGIKTTPYILGATLPAEREEIVARGWTPCLCSLDEIIHFDQLSHEAPVKAHLAIDTGMGRGGFLPDQIPQALEALKNAKGIQLTGIGSHLPVADEDQEFTQGQFELFDSLVEEIQTQFTDKLTIHLSNSAGLLDYQSRTTNLVRPGLMLYGISPSPTHQAELRPVMTLKTRVSLIHELPKGHGVSYGRTVLQRDTRAAVLGIGYGDGYPRSLSDQNTEMLINGKRCPLLGRVTMDQIIVDVTDLPNCQSGDEAILFGEELLLSELAKKAGTIPWELFTQVMPRVERLYI